MSARLMTEPEIRHMRLLWNRKAFNKPSALSRGVKNTALGLNPATLSKLEKLNVVVRIVERNEAGAYLRSWYLSQQGRAESAALFALEDA